jgi:predicted DNA-binding transcriptional regulator
MPRPKKDKYDKIAEAILYQERLKKIRDANTPFVPQFHHTKEDLKKAFHQGRVQGIREGGELGIKYTAEEAEKYIQSLESSHQEELEEKELQHLTHVEEIAETKRFAYIDPIDKTVRFADSLQDIYRDLELTWNTKIPDTVKKQKVEPNETNKWVDIDLDVGTVTLLKRYPKKSGAKTKFLQNPSPLPPLPSGMIPKIATTPSKISPKSKTKSPSSSKILKKGLSLIFH